jgi:hypothetical protein
MRHNRSTSADTSAYASGDTCPYSCAHACADTCPTAGTHTGMYRYTK